MRDAAELVGGAAEPLDQRRGTTWRAGFGSWVRGVDEPRVHAVAAGAPLVLADQERVAVELVRPAVDLSREVVDQALDQGGEAEHAAEVVAACRRSGPRPSRSSWCGRTSHQISRIVLMNPVSTMWLSSQRYSLQFRIKGGRPAVGRPSITLTRCECRPVFRPDQNGLLAESASKVGQVVQDPVADHDRLVARVEPDVDVQAERDEPAGRRLEQVDQARDTARSGVTSWSLPVRERVGRPPEQPQAARGGGALRRPGSCGIRSRSTSATSRQIPVLISR